MLEVIALGVDDARAAFDGGADRIELVGTMNDDGLSPSPALVEQVKDSVPIPVRVMLRTEPGFATTNIDDLIGLARTYSDLEVDGIVLGYLTRGSIDRQVMGELLATITVPYTFHRAVDHASDYEAALADVTRLGGHLTSILTAGSPHGVSAGLDRLLTAAPTYGNLMLVGGGLAPDHVPHLKEAGLSAFHVGSKVRPGGDFTNTVDPRLVADWVDLIS